MSTKPPHTQNSQDQRLYFRIGCTEGGYAHISKEALKLECIALSLLHPVLSPWLFNQVHGLDQLCICEAVRFGGSLSQQPGSLDVISCFYTVCCRLFVIFPLVLHTICCSNGAVPFE